MSNTNTDNQSSANEQSANQPQSEDTTCSAGNTPETEPSKHFLGWRGGTLTILIIIALILLIIFGFPYYQYAQNHESTDDAFIEGNIAPISPRISAHVKEIYVADNQHVQKGELLIKLESATYQARLEAAKAALAVAKSNQQAASINTQLTKIRSKATVERAQASVQQAKANIDSAKAQLRSAASMLNKTTAQLEAAKAQADSNKSDLQRYKQLLKTGAISPQKLSHATAKAKASQANVAAAKAAVTAAGDTITQDKALLAQAKAELVQAQADLDKAQSAPKQIELAVSNQHVRTNELSKAQADVKQAQLNLSYTKIYAPISGTVTRKSVQPGQYLVPGQLTMSIVPNDIWIKANYKETQIQYIHPGQKVTIKVDAYPDHDFTGIVQSLMSGTGSRFSLLPPENATGNYIKVVQRVPVKILFNPIPNLNKYHIAPGMSVVPYIDITSNQMNSSTKKVSATKNNKNTAGSDSDSKGVS